jgi:hypothetical protein
MVVRGQFADFGAEGEAFASGEDGQDAWCLLSWSSRGISIRSIRNTAGRIMEKIVGMRGATAKRELGVDGKGSKDSHMKCLDSGSYVVCCYD